MTSQSKNNRLLPLTVIEAAAGGDVEAINAVLKHYAGYIARLSMRELYDEYGNPHLCVDEELRRRLETKLITKLLTERRRIIGKTGTFLLRRAGRLVRHDVYPRGYAERQIPRRKASVAACRRRRAKHIMIRPYSHSPSVQSVAGDG